jgi:hypothetical protein
MAQLTTLPRPTRRNSELICGQLWHFRTDRYRNVDRLRNRWTTWATAIVATRYDDGRAVTGGSREHLATVIAERIRNGIY